MPYLNGGLDGSFGPGSPNPRPAHADMRTQPRPAGIPLPVRHRRPPSTRRDLPPVAPSVAGPQVAAPIVRVIQVPSCAAFDELATASAPRQPSRDKRLQPAACSLMRRAVPPLRRGKTKRSSPKVPRDHRRPAVLPREAKSSSEGYRPDWRRVSLGLYLKNGSVSRL
jgi:hypothetical protein